MQVIPFVLLLALDSAGRSIPARMAMMAITTSSSISVKPRAPPEAFNDFDRTDFIFRLNMINIIRWGCQIRSLTLGLGNGLLVARADRGYTRPPFYILEPLGI